MALVLNIILIVLNIIIILMEFITGHYYHRRSEEIIN
jgi:hypothetical protein